MISLKRIAVIDNVVFTLFYRLTVLMLVILSFIITCRLLAGDTFTCSVPGGSALSTSFINHYCYSNGTFLDLTYWTNSGASVTPHRGIGPTVHQSNKFYVAYYKWVNLVILLQASYFYLPHLIWKTNENGLLTQLTGNLHLQMHEEEKALSLCILAKYLVMMQGKQVFYAYIYIFCEFLNHVVSLVQIICLVHFFQINDVSESHSGVEVETWADFGDFHFPEVTMCSLYHYGKNGSLDLTEEVALCSLPLNNLYLQSFLFLYGWYIFLAVMSGMALLYRMSLRIRKVRVALTTWKSPLADPQVIRSICSRSSYSDWFLLLRVQKNLLPNHFAELIKKLKIVSQCCEELDACDKLMANEMITTSFSTENKE